jgi:thiol-disulfide isomerase/thioredoxin
MKALRTLFVFGVAALLAVGTILFGREPVATTHPEAVATMAPAWKLKDLDGREVSSDQFKGKVVVIDFWATWCAPCLEEIPGYVALQKKYGPAGLAVVGVSLDRRGPAHVKEFAQAQGINYTLLMADDTVGEAFGGFEAIPTTFLISREGRILNRKTGAVPPEAYEKLVQAALK